jgi:hypothetical protein
MKIDDPKLIYFKVDYYCTIIREILNDCVVNSHISALILAMCCIDYMGIPLSNNTKNTKDNFKQFLNDFMSFANQKYSQSDIQDMVYATRCSVIHTFGESDAMEKLGIKPFFVYGNRLEKEHLNTFNDNGKEFHISISHFVSEVIAGVEKFFRENTDHSLFIEWYKKMIIVDGYGSPMNKLTCVKNNKITYKNIHKVISVLDDNQNILYKEFADNINTKLIKIYNGQEI